MVALSVPFTVIPASDVDPDSPVTTTLMSALSENTIHLEEWMGLSATLKIADHAHAGFAVDGTKVISQVALVFDQVTNQSGSLTNVFAVLATTTVASADLPSNRDAMIIATGEFSDSTNALAATYRLRVDGVVKQSINIDHPVNDAAGIALSEIVNLTSGANRVIEVQGKNTTNSGSFANLNLFSVLIT